MFLIRFLIFPAKLLRKRAQNGTVANYLSYRKQYTPGGLDCKGMPYIILVQLYLEPGNDFNALFSMAFPVYFLKFLKF